jgi:uncharacterized protein YbbK (DUF523 family)
MGISPKVIVSSCLVGKKCAYDGGNRYSGAVLALCEKYGYVDICPEVSGGLSIPREAHEINGGSGEDVLDGKCKVVAPSGKDVSAYFLRGAEITLGKAVTNDVALAVMKGRSPSCGSGRIYAGSFDGKLKDGNGVTAALLIRNGITVFAEEEMPEAAKVLEGLQNAPDRRI